MRFHLWLCPYWFWCFPASYKLVKYYMPFFQLEQSTCKVALFFLLMEHAWKQNVTLPFTLSQTKASVSQGQEKAVIWVESHAVILILLLSEVKYRKEVLASQKRLVAGVVLPGVMVYNCYNFRIDPEFKGTGSMLVKQCSFQHDKTFRYLLSVAPLSSSCLGFPGHDLCSSIQVLTWAFSCHSMYSGIFPQRKVPVNT